MCRVLKIRPPNKPSQSLLATEKLRPIEARTSCNTPWSSSKSHADRTKGLIRARTASRPSLAAAIVSSS